jgi:hypothetical protein
MAASTIFRSALLSVIDNRCDMGPADKPFVEQHDGARRCRTGSRLLAPGRYNIAEIALHHAFYVRSVRGQLSSTPPEPFVLEGEDWFDPAGLSWPEIQAVVEEQQSRLAAVVADTQPDTERFNLVLGITCHAGQVQLIKRLHA